MEGKVFGGTAGENGKRALVNIAACLQKTVTCKKIILDSEIAAQFCCVVLEYLETSLAHGWTDGWMKDNWMDDWVDGCKCLRSESSSRLPLFLLMQLCL